MNGSQDHSTRTEHTLDAASLRFRVNLLGWLELSLVTLGVLTIVFGSYVLLAARTRQLFTSPRAVRMINRGTGTVMASAAVAIAAK